MRLFVSVPAYDRRITCETARALLNEQGAAALAETRLRIMTRQQPRRLLGTERIFRVGARRGRVLGGGW